MRAGPLGALAAWTGFTLPSALLMLLFAYGTSGISGPIGTALIHGLKLVAVAIVAQAVWGMARTLTPDRPRAGLALAALAVVTLLGGAWGQVAAIVAGVLGGLWLCRNAASAPASSVRFAVPRSVGVVCLAASSGSQGLALFDAFYRSGALVFGGARRAAIAAIRRGRAGLDHRCGISCRLWRSASRAGTAVHLRRLPWCGGRPRAKRTSRCGRGSRRGPVSNFVREAVFRHQMTNLSPKITANWVFASVHSRGGRFHSWAA